MDISRFIHELLNSDREATEAEVRGLREHVAQVGFDPNARERVRGRGAGIIWRGRVIRGRDMLPPAEAHYIRHVLGDPEWPEETTFPEYLESIRQTIIDERSGIFLSYYQDRVQVGFIGRSRHWRGPNGGNWILVEYRQQLDHIMTAFQVESLDHIAAHPRRSALRWLISPQ
jgi:hypothetical protein